MTSTSILGLFSAIGLVALAIAMGGQLPAFLDIPSILIVVGGTLSVVFISFSFTDLQRTAQLASRALGHGQPAFGGLARHLLGLAKKARADGLLSLQQPAAQEPHAFLRQALSLAVDGAPIEAVEKVLVQDTQSLLERQERALALLRRAAEVAPAMGLIGTLIGLVQMLGQLSSPEAIGPAMAVAILTTFYGAVLAYMVFTPLAAKLEQMGADDLLTRKLMLAATLSMIKQENPRGLELSLNALLPPSQRVRVFNK
jgi:chemotaxis protein MotA